MGKQKKTRNFALRKKIIGRNDPRIKSNQDKIEKATKVEAIKKSQAEKHIDQVPTALFFQYNTQLGPPYNVLVDTNFINFRYFIFYSLNTKQRINIFKYLIVLKTN
jgi:U3 small nucleolar RNA-associated protein 24